jgi:hypothetical protein
MKSINTDMLNFLKYKLRSTNEQYPLILTKLTKGLWGIKMLTNYFVLLPSKDDSKFTFDSVWTRLYDSLLPNKTKGK